MNADTYELKTILALERRYVIPTFQRDYEWTKESQWELLFEDLESVADRLGAARQRAEAQGEQASRADKGVTPHFLGAVVLEQLPSSAGGLDLRAVIDGQQRLTTLQLLLRGLLDVLVETNSPRASQVRRLIENPGDVVRLENERYKLWPRRRDRDIWQRAMGDAHEGKGNHAYLEARRYFRDRAREAVNGGVADRSDHLVDAALSLFKLVVIDLEDNDDAQVIFEVLNGRQTPLSATDLVKNLLFLRAELSDETELEKLYDRHWAHFDDPWWKKEVGRGHAARARRDVLLSSWLSATSTREVNVGHLYGEVRRYIDGATRKIVDVLAELTVYADAFRSISEPEADVPQAIAAAYVRLDRLGVTTALPLLTWLRTLPAAELPAPAHERAVRAVDSWVVRRIVAGANTRGYAKRFVEVLSAAKTAHKAGKAVDIAVCTALVDLSDNLRWPTDVEVEQAFLERPLYINLSQERIRLLLGAIDERLHSENVKGEKPSFRYEALQIEHILPQNWRPHWPVTTSDPTARVLAEQERDLNVHRLGNLTLVTAPLNPSMSNAAWPAKRQALREHSSLRLNTAVVSEEIWDEKRIESRARALAAVACRVWPGP